jgi:micrococcal nuclease
MNKNLYTYKAFVVKVYDGDTITVDIDLGFGVFYKKQKIRLMGINAPELKGDERENGLIVRDWLREKILNKEVIIKTIKDKKGKYGRYLGYIFLDNININEQMLNEGLVEPYD